MMINEYIWYSFYAAFNLSFMYHDIIQLYKLYTYVGCLKVKIISFAYFFQPLGGPKNRIFSAGAGATRSIEICGVRGVQAQIGSNWITLDKNHGCSKLFQAFPNFAFTQVAGASSRAHTTQSTQPNGAVAPWNSTCSNKDSNIFKHFLGGTCTRTFENLAATDSQVGLRLMSRLEDGPGFSTDTMTQGYMWDKGFVRKEDIPWHSKFHELGCIILHDSFNDSLHDAAVCISWGRKCKSWASNWKIKPDRHWRVFPMNMLKNSLSSSVEIQHNSFRLGSIQRLWYTMYISTNCNFCIYVSRCIQPPLIKHSN